MLDSCYGAATINQGLQISPQYLQKAGLQCSDDEIHDLGIRLLTLCQAAADTEKESRTLSAVLTGVEIEAIKFIKQELARTGTFPSVRILATALGYRSSRSGHVMVRRLESKGILGHRGGRLAIVDTSLE